MNTFLDIYKLAQTYPLYFIGGFISLIAFVDLVIILNRRDWIETEARIVDSRVEEQVDKAYIIGWSDYKPVKEISNTSYKKHLEYEYVVGEEKYLGKRVYSGFLSFLTYNKFLTLTYGSRQKVFYKKQEPRESFLFHSSGLKRIMFVILGLYLATFAKEHFQFLLVVAQEYVQN